MNVKVVIKWFLLLVVMIVAGRYLSQNKETLSSLQRLGPQQIAALLGLTLAGLISLAFQFKLLMRFFAINLSFNEWFGLTMCSAMYNYFLPGKGGTWIRAYYLKKKYCFAYASYLPLLLSSFFLMFVASGLCGTVSMGFAITWSDRQQWQLFFTLFPGLTVATAFAGYVAIKLSSMANKSNLNPKLAELVTRFHEGLLAFQTQPSLVWQYMGTRIFFIIVNAIAYVFCLHCLGIEQISLAAAIAIMALTSFSAVVAITPGNIGVRETVIGFSCYYLGISLDISLLAACIVRAASMILVFSLGLVYSQLIFKNIISEYDHGHNQ